MSLYLGTQKIAANSSSREIGEIIQSTIPLTDAGLHLLDGALISGVGSYAKFVNYIAGLVSSYPNLFETEANWQSAVTTYGVCGKFVYDSVNNTVRLPKYSDKIYTSSISNTAPVKGDGMALGLKLITDSSTNLQLTRSSSSGGAFVTSGLMGNANQRAGLDTDSTKSGVISDLANITTALEGYYYIVIATSTKTQIEVDIDEIATDLNGKADVDLTNVNASGTSLASGWSMPSNRYIELTVGASGSTYTAPANGWFLFAGRSTANGQYLNIGGVNLPYMQNYSSGSNDQMNLTYPAGKGKNIVIYYNIGGTKTLRFYYAEGESNV